MSEPELIQRAYTAIIRHFMESGRAPHYLELSGLLGIGVEEARAVQREAAEAGPATWLVPETDYISSWAPFSNVPTQHLVSVDGHQRWFAQ